MAAVILGEITKSYGGHLVWGPLNWTVEERARVGLVGANGTGKSTLLRIIAGLDTPDTGDVMRRKGLRTAYLAQEVPGDERSIRQTVLEAWPERVALEAHLAAVEQQLGEQALTGDMQRLSGVLDKQAKLLAAWEAIGGPRAHGNALMYLRQLGFDDVTIDTPTLTLSGGQRKLVALAGCLLRQPDLLLLDEPDTHLDLAHKQMLEALLRGYRGAVVLVSHDRYLLDETVNAIAELEDGELRIWEGNYSAFAVAKELALLRQQQQYIAQQKEIERLEAAIARFKLWASLVVNERHIRQARNKQRQIDSMERIERPVLERKRMRLQLRPRQRGGQKVLELRDVGVAFGSEIVLLDIKRTFWRGERVGIIGANGAGKSVLGRVLTGEQQPSWGEVWSGPSTTIGYYAQGHETLNPAHTLIEAIREVKPMYESEAVALLGTFLFPYRVCTQRVDELSGGERSRLQLARLMIGGANCLVLDEPTNHLDIASAEVLEAALSDFDGTLIVISHDRYFLDRVVDEVLLIEDGGITSYLGGYSAYLQASQSAGEPPRQSDRLAGKRSATARLARKS